MEGMEKILELMLSQFLLYVINWKIILVLIISLIKTLYMINFLNIWLKNDSKNNKYL